MDIFENVNGKYSQMCFKDKVNIETIVYVVLYALKFLSIKHFLQHMNV